MVLSILLLIAALGHVLGALLTVGTTNIGATRVHVVIANTFLVVVMVLAAVALL